MWVVIGYLAFIACLAAVHAVMTLVDVEPTEENLCQDLACIERCFDTEHLLCSNAVGVQQTEMYYLATARHFAWLEGRVGAGMHGSLKLGSGMPDRGVQASHCLDFFLNLFMADVRIYWQ